MGSLYGTTGETQQDTPPQPEIPPVATNSKLLVTKNSREIPDRQAMETADRERSGSAPRNRIVNFALTGSNLLCTRILEGPSL